MHSRQPRPPDPALATLLDLGIIAVLVLAFHAPYLQVGLPGGDFASDLMVTFTETRLIPTPFDFPVWNPLVMCGRPEVGFWRPFRLFELPFSGMEPIAAQKAGGVLFHIFAGWAMYALLRDSRAGRWAALFGGVIYPIMPAHIGRAAVHGHIHVVRFFALVPLLMLGWFRLRRSGPRATVALGLILAACLLGDAQRTLLVAVMLGGVLCFELAIGWLRRRFDGTGEPRTVLSRMVKFNLAFLLAVLIAGFEMINGFTADSYRRGFSDAALERYIERWSNDSLYTFLDRNGAIGDRLDAVSDDFYVSSSRYVGISLVALLLVALLARPTARIWGMVGLAMLAVWLASGGDPIGDDVLGRWHAVFASDAVGAGTKLVTAIAILVTLVAAAVPLAWPLRARLGPRRAWAVALAIVTLAGLTLLFTTPYPLLKRLVFFLRDQRNPDWFQVAVVSMCVAYGAALGFGVLASRLAARAISGRIAIAALCLLPVADLWPYRALLTEGRDAQRIREYQQAAAVIAADPADFRVLGDKSYDNMDDGIVIWHGKRLAWDFRWVTAPLRTRAFINHIHRLANRGGHPGKVATLAGLANVKYLVTDPDTPLLATGPLQSVASTAAMQVLANASFRPFVQAWPAPHLLVASDEEVAITLVGYLADRGHALIHTDAIPTDAQLAIATARYADDGAFAAGIAPPGAQRVGLGRPLEVEPAPPWPQPTLAHERPEPARIQIEIDASTSFFLVVSESYHPDWKATLNGQPLALHPTHFAFLGAAVPAGQHSVELVFARPVSYYLWLPISLLSAMAALAYLALARSRGASREAEPQ